VSIEFGKVGDSETLALYGTGIRNRSSLSRLQLCAGNDALVVRSAGAQGSPGVDEVRADLPRSCLGRGTLALTLTADGKPADSIVIDCQPSGPKAVISVSPEAIDFGTRSANSPPEHRRRTPERGHYRGFSWGLPFADIVEYVYRIIVPLNKCIVS
jgi:hypothetical protein